VDLWFYRCERPTRSVPRERREPQAGPASGLSGSVSKDSNADGDGVSSPVPNTDTTATGEGVAGLPGSESVARAEGGARNRGGLLDCAQDRGEASRRILSLQVFLPARSLRRLHAGIGRYFESVSE
jgi:hypothetical protein